MAGSSGERADGPGSAPSGDGSARHRHASPDRRPPVTQDVIPAVGGAEPARPKSRWTWSSARGGEAAATADVVPPTDLAVAAAMPQSSSSVRPYFFTRGRTRSAVDLEIETLVSVVAGTTPPSGAALAAFEQCHEARSVAEVAALMAVPLGVARVLLGDLAEAGAIVVHQTVSAEGPALALMERVLSGLRNL